MTDHSPDKLLDEVRKGGKSKGSMFEAGEEQHAPSDFPIKMDSFDHAVAEELREESDRWQDVEATRSEELDVFGDFMKSIFAGLWKPRPEAEDNLTPKGKRLREVMDVVESMPEWKSLREDTVLNDFGSALGTVAVARQVTLPAMEEQKEEKKGKEGEEGEDGEEGGEEGGMTTEEVLAVRAGVRKGMEEASNAIQQVSTIAEMAGLSTHNPGEISNGKQLKLNEEQLTLLRRLYADYSFQRIAAIIGQLKPIAMRARRESVKHGRDEIADITMGDDLLDMLPTEFAFLALPELEEIFLYNFVEKTLLQYEYESEQSTGKGPMSIIIDRSGSMSGDKLSWAIAMALSFYLVAKKDKRTTQFVFFNSGSPTIFTAPDGVLDMEDFASIVGMRAVGGTLLTTALQHVKVLHDTHDRKDTNEELKRADVILITDAIIEEIQESDIRQMEEIKEREGTEWHSFIVGRRSVADKLEKLSDYTYFVEGDKITTTAANNAVRNICGIL